MLDTPWTVDDQGLAVVDLAKVSGAAAVFNKCGSYSLTAEVGLCRATRSGQPPSFVAMYQVKPGTASGEPKVPLRMHKVAAFQVGGRQSQAS